MFVDRKQTICKLSLLDWICKLKKWLEISDKPPKQDNYYFQTDLPNVLVKYSNRYGNHFIVDNFIMQTDDIALTSFLENSNSCNYIDPNKAGFCEGSIFWRDQFEPNPHLHISRRTNPVSI